MNIENREWQKVTGLSEVQVFDADGKLIESFNKEGLAVELFDNEPSDD